jgi:hypothetical protein
VIEVQIMIFVLSNDGLLPLVYIRTSLIYRRSRAGLSIVHTRASTGILRSIDGCFSMRTCSANIVSTCNWILPLSPNICFFLLFNQL